MQAILAIVNEYRLLTSAAVILCLLLWESLVPAFLFFKDRMAERVRHGMVNLMLFVLNLLIVRFVFVLLWLILAEWTSERQIGIANWLGLQESIWHTGLVVLLLDFWTYWWHLANHKINFLWRFHRVHHSDTEMDVTTASRFHFGEIIFSSVTRMPIIILFGATVWEIAIYELVLFPIVQFHHANIAIPDWLDKVLRVIFVTPSMHKVHHSTIEIETDSNYTSMLSCWDRLFGSFRVRDSFASIRFGVAAPPDENTKSLIHLAAMPFRHSGRRE